MHNFEKIIEHFLKTLLRNQGLNHDAEELQNAYRIHYYMEKHRQLFHVICSAVIIFNLRLASPTRLRWQLSPPIGLWHLISDRLWSSDCE